jgi:hypothetical protein
MKIDNNVFNSLHHLLFQHLRRKSMSATFHSMFNSLKFGLLHLTGQTNYRKGRAKVNNGIILGTIFPGTI